MVVKRPGDGRGGREFDLAFPWVEIPQTVDEDQVRRPLADQAKLIDVEFLMGDGLHRCRRGNGGDPGADDTSSRGSCIRPSDHAGIKRDALAVAASGGVLGY